MVFLTYENYFERTNSWKSFKCILMLKGLNPKDGEEPKLSGLAHEACTCVPCYFSILYVQNILKLHLESKACLVSSYLVKFPVEWFNNEYYYYCTFVNIITECLLFWYKYPPCFAINVIHKPDTAASTNIQRLLFQNNPRTIAYYEILLSMTYYIVWSSLCFS